MLHCTVPCDSISTTVHEKHIIFSSICDDKLFYFMVGIHFDLSHVNCYYIVLTIHCTFYDLFTSWNQTHLSRDP